MCWGSGLKAALPFAAMVTAECVEIGLVTLCKAAMKNGMSSFVFVVYYNALGTLILLPRFLCCRFRSKMPPMNFRLLSRFFLLGAIGAGYKTFAFMGIKYSSPTLAAAIGNLIPAFTFLFAVTLGMEKLDLRNPSSQAKSLGTIIAISGALVVALYRGPPMLANYKTDSYQLSQPSNWALGGLLLTITCILSSGWNILQAVALLIHMTSTIVCPQAATAKEYQDPVTIVFFYSFFDTILSALFSFVLERDRSAWEVHSGIEMIAIVYAAVMVTCFTSTVVTWCLRERGPVFVATYKPLGIAIAVIMGFVFLGDTLHLGSLIGATIISAGFYAVIWGQAREMRPRSNNNISSLESSSTDEESTPLLRSCIHN